MMTVLPVFCPDWAKYAADDDARETYVAAELRRLFAEGGAVLLAVLQMHVDEACQMTALRQLAENADADGEPICEPGWTWKLRLKEGAVPPISNAQGIKLPKEKQGKVLAARVGNLGGSRGREDSSRASLEWTGQRRAMKASSGQDLYSHREVTAKATAFSLNEAVLILRQWGVGVQPKQYLRNRAWKPGESNEDIAQGQDQWLVLEGPAPTATLTKGEKDKAA